LHFVECARCRLVFADPLPDLNTIAGGNRALNTLHVSRGRISQYRGSKEFARFPTALPIDHQQHLFAEKISDL